MWGLFAPLNYLPEMASLHGFGDFALDAIGQFNAICIVTTLSGVLVLAFWLPLDFQTYLAGIIVFSLLFGFISGGFVSALLGHRARGLTGLPIEGAIKDREGNKLTGLMYFAGATMILRRICTGAA
ncbi:uncharacterized protein ATNIH1004_003537 [Aspergillus tanneri]|uniref:Uncharacterized protein n=1 Tax=Aspergillus tanneri TaxID=1220188 RepID=A0A5M9MVE0_9EURO|nr:uncharacterized protein ATNIH1004_003537 [Aspergillus tanneri]KAA8650848.1 hypothetical protein ATNIH1004_003537 [Aspergillus tanneri]